MSVRRYELQNPSQAEAGLTAAAAALAAGELVVVPTETVYGLCADLARPEAIDSLYEVKGRPRDKPLQVMVPDADAAQRLVAAWSPAAERIAAAFWPGPLTLVVPAVPDLPAPVLGPGETIGLRCPDQPMLRRLLGLTGPLAASSANRSGEPPATTAEEAASALAADVAVILDGGAAAVGVPSTVVRLDGDQVIVLRPGAITAEEVRRHV